MSSISSNFGRAPNLLFAQSAVNTLGRTNLSLHRTQMQLATGLAVSRFSDDAVRAAAISVLDDRLDRSFQRQRNLSHAEASLNTLDQALGDANDLIQEARAIASAQVGIGSSATERQQQALVVDSLIQSLLTISNRESAAGHIFAGSTPGSPAVVPFRGGYRYAGGGPGLVTDLGIGSTIPITLGGNSIMGSTAARIEGTVDLQPAISGESRLSEMSGARGMGIMLGRLEFALDPPGGSRHQVDLSSAGTVQDVVNGLTAAIRAYETEQGVTVLGPGGVSFESRSLSIDVVNSGAGGGGGGGPELVFFEVGSGQTASDLGLGTFTAGNAAGEDLQPRLLWGARISELAGIAGPLGSIKINNLGQSRIVDLSQAETIEDLRNLIQGTGLGIRVEINAAGTGLNIINEVAAGRAQAMSIEEVPGHNLTATRLGIRSLTGMTRLSSFNDGRGIEIASGNTDPVSGGPDPLRDSDFVIRLGNAAQTTFSVNLRPQDIATVDTLLARINDEAAAAGVNVPADFAAVLSDGANGIVLQQNAGFSGPVVVSALNNSPAAEQLGLLAGGFDSTIGSFRAADRAQVRVESLFTNLIDLRDSLLANDTVGITLAGGGLEQAVDRLSETRALVGGYARRVQNATRQQEDQTLLDETTRSMMRDVDFTEAAMRLSLLQTQLQAAMAVTAQSMSRSLLDFLG